MSFFNSRRSVVYGTKGMVSCSQVFIIDLYFTTKMNIKEIILEISLKNSSSDFELLLKYIIAYSK